MQLRPALRRQHEPLGPAGAGAREAGGGERVPGRPALRPETLLAVRVARHELANPLELAVGYLEVLVADPDRPVHLRAAARTALCGAEVAVQLLEVAQQACSAPADHRRAPHPRGTRAAHTRTHEEDTMTPLSLQRQAPVAPGVAECRRRDAPIGGTWQDHLLAGQPDTIQLAAAIPLLATVHHSALLPPAEWTGRSRP